MLFVLLPLRITRFALHVDTTSFLSGGGRGAGSGASHLADFWRCCNLFLLLAMAEK